MKREGIKGEEAVRGSGRDKEERRDKKQETVVFDKRGGFNLSLACQIAIRGKSGT